MTNKNTSPVGWYVASYLLRFVELGRPDIDDPEAKFLSWENTILVKAADLDEAYEKAASIAKQSSEPYKGGPDEIDVQWKYEGITQILPIYEELEDGAEIMWAEHSPRKLKNLQKLVGGKGEFCQ
jgi:hypothetical protein